MYINYVNDRKSLGYECLVDTQCGNRLVLITDSSVVFVKNVTLNGKSKVKRVLVYGMVLFQLGQPLVPCAAAIILPLPPPIERLSTFQERTKNCYPQIAHIPAPKVDKIRLTNDRIKQFNNLALQLNNGSIKMEEAILQTRGGDGWVDVIVFIVVAIFLNRCSDAFQVTPLPHQDTFGWINEKHDRKPTQHTSRKSSRFDLQSASVNENMCPELADEKFVMSYQEAHNLVAQTYPGYLEVDESCRITDWQAAKHMYHANGMGVDSADYGFTQRELELIRGEPGCKRGGLIAYAQRGYRLPPIEMVRDYQLRLKESCETAPIKRTNVPYYDVNGGWQATVFATPNENNSSGIVIVFNESTGDLITGDTQKRASFNRFIDENYLGGTKWMLKWGNK